MSTVASSTPGTFWIRFESVANHLGQTVELVEAHMCVRNRDEFRCRVLLHRHGLSGIRTGLDNKRG